MRADDGEAQRGAQLMLLRGDGRAAVTLPLSPMRLLLGFLGVGVCPAFCAGLLASQMGLSGMLEAGPQRMLGASLFHGLVGDPVSSYEVLAKEHGRRPELLPPPPAESVPEPELDGTEMRTPEERRGRLRVISTHLQEAVDVLPFRPDGTPDVDAFERIAHLWRCRITGHEAPIDPQLVRLLTTLNDIYDRPVFLVSGHRMPNTLGTKKTSQHAAGTAADIKIAGVSAQKLRAKIIALGAKGVGLYPEKGFVHVDFRDKPRYLWVYKNGEEHSVGTRLAEVHVEPSEREVDFEDAEPGMGAEPTVPSTVGQPAPSKPAAQEPEPEEPELPHRLASLRLF